MNRILVVETLREVMTREKLKKLSSLESICLQKKSKRRMLLKGENRMIFLSLKCKRETK